MSCRGISILEPPCPPPSPAVLSAGLLLTPFLSHSSLSHFDVQHFYAFEKICFPSTGIPVPGPGHWAQPCSALGLLELAGIGCVLHGAALISLYRGPFAATPLPTPGHGHPIQLNNVSFQWTKQLSVAETTSANGISEPFYRQF